MSRYSHAVIIPTRNRPQDVRRCLTAVMAQSPLPVEVIVVDSSDSNATQSVVTEFCASSDRVKQAVRFLRSDVVGIPVQRNLGVENTSGHIVHFLDDDSLPEPGYLSAIEAAFAEDAQVGGVGGCVTNMPRRTFSRPERFFLIGSNTPGSVLSSGNCAPTWSITARRYVDWLEGCSMSFRREVFVEHSFDPNLSGYAMGEDVEFSYRIAQSWKLLSIPDARLLHTKSPLERTDNYLLRRMEIKNRFLRVRTGVGRYRRWAFWVSVLGELLVWAARAIKGVSRSSLRSFVAVARGAGDCFVLAVGFNRP